MTAFAHVVSTEAEVDGHRTAEDALPLDVLGAMFWASSLTCSEDLHLTVLAKQIFLVCLFFEIQILLAINHASKVWFGTFVALIE